LLGNLLLTVQMALRGRKTAKVQVFGLDSRLSAIVAQVIHDCRGFGAS
jgi:hypothetical protein